MGLWRTKVSDFGFEEAADLLYEMQMSVSSLSWAGGFTGSDGNTFKLSVEDGIEAVYQAHMIGADKLIVHPGGRNGHTESHAMRLVKSGFAELAPFAQDLGVQLLLEPVSTKQNPWNFITNLDSYLDLLNEFSPSELALVLDLFQIGRDQNFSDNMELYSNRIALVQLADGKFVQDDFVRCDLGSGLIPLENWLNRLDSLGYEGQFEIELHGREFEATPYHMTIQASQHFISNSKSQLVTEIFSR